MSEEDLNKILAATASALSKREELKKLFAEASEIKNKLSKEKLNKESIENLLDKSYIIASRFTGVGKHIEALDLLSYTIILGKKHGLEDTTNKLVEKFYQICFNAIKEAKQWGQLDQAILVSFLVSVIESLNLVSPPEDLRKEILDLETNTNINPKTLDAKRDLNSLLINPTKEGIEDFLKKYEELFKKKGLGKELEILVNMVKLLST